LTACENIYDISFVYLKPLIQLESGIPLKNIFSKKDEYKRVEEKCQPPATERVKRRREGEGRK
jgi:hypothetical protein